MTAEEILNASRAGHLVVGIAKWNEQFETADSRKRSKLDWIKNPTQESRGFMELFAGYGERGMTCYAIFDSMCKFMGREPSERTDEGRYERGRFLWNDRPMKVHHLASKCHVHELDLFVEALELLASPEVGWILLETWDDQAGSASGTKNTEQEEEKSASSSGKASQRGQNTAGVASNNRRGLEVQIEEKKKNAGGAAEDVFLNQVCGETGKAKSSSTAGEAKASESSLPVGQTLIRPAIPDGRLSIEDALDSSIEMIRSFEGLNSHREELANEVKGWLQALYAAGKHQTGKRLQRDLEQGISLAVLSDDHAEAVICHFAAAAQNQKDGKPDPWLNLDWRRLKLRKGAVSTNGNKEEGHKTTTKKVHGF